MYKGRVFIKTIGRFSVRYKDNIVEETDSATFKHSWDLMKYLTHNNGKPVTRAELLQNVWPNVLYEYENPSKFRINTAPLKGILSNLRLLDNDTLIITDKMSKFHRFSDAYDIVTDIEEIMSACAVNCDVTPDIELINCIAALKLFTGEYMENTAELDWVIEGRRNCDALFLLLIDKILNLISLTGSTEYLDLVSEKVLTFAKYDIPTAEKLRDLYTNLGYPYLADEFYSKWINNAN